MDFSAPTPPPLHLPSSSSSFAVELYVRPLSLRVRFITIFPALLERLSKVLVDRYLKEVGTLCFGWLSIFFGDERIRSYIENSTQDGCLSSLAFTQEGDGVCLLLSCGSVCHCFRCLRGLSRGLFGDEREGVVDESQEVLVFERPVSSKLTCSSGTRTLIRPNTTQFSESRSCSRRFSHLKLS